MTHTKTQRSDDELDYYHTAEGADEVADAHRDQVIPFVLRARTVPAQPLSSGVVIIPSRDIPRPSKVPVKFTLAPLFPPLGTMIVISAPFSQGKTVFCRRSALALATGEPFAGLTPAKPYRVLYYDLETPEFERHREYNQAMGSHDNLAFVRDLPTTLNLRTPEGCAAFEAEIARWDVVFLDPLSKVWRISDENNQSEADTQMSVLGDIARHTRTLIVCTLNTGWDGQHIRGASSRPDRADMVINYSGPKEGIKRTLKVTKSRWDNLGLNYYVMFDGAYDYVVDPSPAPTRAIASESAATRAAILRLLLAGPLNRREIADQLPDPPTAAIDKALMALKADRYVSQSGKGRPYKITAQGRKTAEDDSD